MDTGLANPLKLRVSTEKRPRPAEDGLGTPQHLPKVKAIAMQILNGTDLASISPTSLIRQLTAEFSDSTSAEQEEGTTAELLEHAPAIIESALDYAELHCNTPQQQMQRHLSLDRSLCFSPLTSLEAGAPHPKLVSAVAEAVSPKAAGFKRVSSAELGVLPQTASSGDSTDSLKAYKVSAQSLSPVVSPKHAPADPMFLIHPALKEPLAEHLLPLLSLEDLANLRASCRAMRDLAESGPAGFSNTSHLDACASYPPIPTLRSPFEATRPN